jgi:hypothetical protein
MRKYEQVLKMVLAVIYRSTRDVPVYCDGSHDLLWIADKSNRAAGELFWLIVLLRAPL